MLLIDVKRYRHNKGNRAACHNGFGYARILLRRESSCNSDLMQQQCFTE